MATPQEKMMSRPASVAAKERADLYATRAVLIELLKMLQLSSPGTVNALRANLVHTFSLRPDDIACTDSHIRDAAEMILQEAE
jgi:hypothetical protein